MVKLAAGSLLIIAGALALAEAGNGKRLKASPAQSSDKIVFASHRDGNWEIYSADPEGRDQTRLTKRGGHNRFPLWSPDRTRIAFASQQRTHEDGWDFWVMNADGTTIRRLCSGMIAKSHREWSRDGKRIALTRKVGGNVDVYVVEVESAKLTRLTSSPAEDRDPTWSADGQHIAFSSERDGNREIYVMRADGSSVRRLTNDRATDSSPVWSPDGSRIAFVSSRDGAAEIHVVRADGASAERLTRGAKSSSDPPLWSPNASRIVFQVADSGRYDIGLVHVREKRQRILVSSPHNDGSYTWSPDGAYIAYISGRGGAETLHLVNVDSGRAREVTRSWSLTPHWSH